MVVINPIAGGGRRVQAAADRLALARSCATQYAGPVDVVLTEHAGHAHALAAAARRDDAALVIAWGGDGTVNEVASALAGGPTALGIVPGGSGNGLAGTLGIPRRPREAFACAFGSRERHLDCGDLDGRFFANVAGIGLDARIAAAFASRRADRRGLAGYLRAIAGELRGHAPDVCTVTVDGRSWATRTMLVAIANGSEYGNHVRVAPPAQPDDGLFDVVIVEHRRVVTALRQVPALLRGGILQVEGVHHERGTCVTIGADRPLMCHVDGEPFAAGSEVHARLRPAALRVRVPTGSR